MPGASGDVCVSVYLCVVMPGGGFWAVDRPHTMLPFESEKDREGEMKGNRDRERK